MRVQRRLSAERMRQGVGSGRSQPANKQGLSGGFGPVHTRELAFHSAKQNERQCREPNRVCKKPPCSRQCDVGRQVELVRQSHKTLRWGRNLIGARLGIGLFQAELKVNLKIQLTFCGRR